MLVMLVATGIIAGFVSACGPLVEGDGRALQPLSSSVKTQLSAMGSSAQAAMMIRIYKQDSVLEIWKEVPGGTFKLFKSYDICTFSGELGPKIREGDRQSPEGFYTVTRGLLNPKSNYYLSFNIGFPNKFDRAYGRTGSNIMVHGDCSSRGCYAMTDVQVAEIYALARESFAGGNRNFQVQIYPFRMTPQNMALHSDSPNLAYWQNLKTGFDHTEVTGRPPTWDVCGGEYVFNASAQSGRPLDARAACPALSRDDDVERLVAARQSAQQAIYETAVASYRAEQSQRAADLAKREAEAILAAERSASQAAAMAERNAAINQSVSGVGDAVGGFFQNLFGGGNSNANSTSPPMSVINPAIVPPVPLNPPQR